MAQNLKIIPETKDYEIENGSPIPSERIHEDVYYALMIPAGQWIHGVSGQGSELYRLKGIKRTNQIEQLFSAYASAAIEKQVIQTGRARALSIRNLGSDRTGTLNQLDVEPRVTNVASILNFKPI